MEPSASESADVAAEVTEQETAFRLESMRRADLIGRRVKVSDGSEGEIAHVEYESPERVALVKIWPESPSPLSRVGVDRLSPTHLPYIVELLDR